MLKSMIRILTNYGTVYLSNGLVRSACDLVVAVIWRGWHKDGQQPNLLVSCLVKVIVFDLVTCILTELILAEIMFSNTILPNEACPKWVV